MYRTGMHHDSIQPIIYCTLVTNFIIVIFIIIVCSFCFRPRLGPTLTKVLVVGGIYFVAAFIDGITRASKVHVCCMLYTALLCIIWGFFMWQTTVSGFDLTFIVTSVLLFLIDIGIVYWISFYYRLITVTIIVVCLFLN